jgi:putative solute:sodium symporter small subunit
MSAQASDGHADYWRKNLRLTALLLAVWFMVTFVAAFFARDLSFRFFGWPFGFWMAAQGALLIYLAIIGIYAGVMNRLDEAHGVDERDD